MGTLKVNGDINATGSITALSFLGNASTASKLATARTISLTGSVTGSGTFDGSGNLSIATTTNHSHNYLPLNGGTVTGTLTLSNTADASGTSAATPALIIGGTSTTAHIQIDNNEIIAKSNGTTPTTLYLNADGGLVSIGSGGLTVGGTITGTGQLQVNAPIVGYNYSNSNNEPAFIWDKPGSNWTGMGPNGSSNTIHFGPAMNDSTTGRFTWVNDFDQYWHFQGAIEATGTIYAQDIWTKHPTGGEADIGVVFASGKYLYLWGNNSSGTRGLYDSNKGVVITVTDSSATFNGNASTATALTTSSAGSTTTPIYFSSGKPTAASPMVIAKNQTTYDINTLYDASLTCVANGSNGPGTKYGCVLTMPYRKAHGNTTPDYAGQIFIPNGDASYPDALYYRTSLATSWKGWKSIIHSGSGKYYGTASERTSMTATDGDIFFQTS